MQENERLLEFLRVDVDVFAWSPYEAPGVDPNFICHQLNVNPFVIPKRQPPRRPSKEHAEAVRSEVAKLKQVGAIKEVFLLSMVNQYGGGKEEDRKVASVRGLHGPQ